MISLSVVLRAGRVCRSGAQEMVHCCLFALLVVISILPVVSSAASPRLALRQTNDVTFTCSTSDLWRRMYALSALQIARKMHAEGSQEEQDVVLATADVSGFRASSQLNSFVHAATGTVNSTAGCMHKDVNTAQSLFQIDGNIGRQRDSWLKLTIPDVTTCDFGTYVCRLVYVENSGDSNMSVVLLGSVEIRSSLTNNSLQSDKSFSVHFSRGVAMVCEFDTADISAKWNVSIIRDNADTIVAVSSDNVRTTNSPRLLSVPVSFTGTSYSLDTHLVNVSCQDQGRYMCSVQDQSVRPRNTAQQNVSVDGCMDGCKMPSCTDTEKEKSHAMEPTVHDSSSVSVGVGMGITVLLGVVVLLLCLVLKFRGWRPKTLKNPITLLRTRFNHMNSSNDDQSGPNDERRFVACRPTRTTNTIYETSSSTINLHGHVHHRSTTGSELIAPLSCAHHKASPQERDLTDLGLRHIAFDTETSPRSDGHEDESLCTGLTKNDACAPPLASYSETRPWSEDSQVDLKVAGASSYSTLDRHLQTSTCTDTGGRMHDRVKVENSDVESDDLGKALVDDMPKYISDTSDEDNDEDDRLLSQSHPDSPTYGIRAITASSVLTVTTPEPMSDNSREEQRHDAVFSLPIQATEVDDTYSVWID